VRGKILNCLKTDYDKILKSDIILDLIKVLGCGLEIKNKYNKQLNNFNIKNLRWNKIIICTDADVDGYQIRALLLTMFYKLMPSLIQHGKVYIAESPLYEIIAKDKQMFAFTEQEKNKIINKLKGKKYIVQRSKGLGENNPDMMWQTTMNPETRRLIQVIPEDSYKMSKMFNLLLGDDLQGRKDYIAENGYKYLDNIEVI
jgi:DNA gyrase subunit B